MLRTQGLAGNAAPGVPSERKEVEKKRFSSQTEELYFNAYQTSLKDNNETKRADLKKINQLFDNLQWGTGSSYQEIFNRLKKSLPVNGEIVDINRALNWLINENILLAKGNNNLPSFAEIEQLIHEKVVIDKLIYECGERKGPLVSHVAKLGPIKEEIVVPISFEMLFLKAMGLKPHSVYTHALDRRNFHQSKLSTHSEKQQKDGIKSLILNYTNTQYLIEEIKKQALLLEKIFPLPPLKGKNDFSGAYKILNLTENCTVEEIKKRYKELAKTKHPDRFISEDIPEVFKQKANTNFHLIQEAYDMLLEKHKS